jgi:3-hydroxyacyl-CoA dehydrogenase
MPSPVSLRIENNIAVITVDNPPVNALSHQVRSGMWDAVEKAGREQCEAILLHCAGRTYFAGADITEFGKPPADPWLPKLLDRLEAFDGLVVSAIHGTALGGGLETAMASHYRMASADAKLGLPEVTLGILPGAGGTQRAPRLIGVEASLELILSGKPMSAAKGLELGLIDRIAEGDLFDSAFSWVGELLAQGKGPRKTSELPVPADHLADDYFENYRAVVARKTRGLPAPLAIIDCVERATKSDFSEGSEYENARFLKLMTSSESAGLCHVFFAQRQASRVDGLAADTPLRPLASVGIIGAGTMGGGIAMSFANAGFPVTVLELNQQALDHGLAVCRSNYDRSVTRGRFSQQQADQFMELISGTTSYDDLAAADLVIEAVFEDPEIKKTVFRQLDHICKQGAILASNTSYQDIDEIAAVTSRPGDVVGMHFFSPANVMKLLEVVRGEKTSDDVVATVMRLAKKIRKVPVLARVCYGFIGNRMLTGYFREAQMMLLEGATPAQIDQAMESFGMAMGPLAVADLAGLDVGYKARKAIANFQDHPANHIANQLVEKGRLGQKSGAGYYQYDPATRKRLDDPEVEKMIRDEAERLAIAAREFTAEEIVERCIYPLINEGARILQEGIAQRPSDIDIVYIFGYGFPAHRGGPMLYADTVGAKAIYQRICEFRDHSGRDQDWQPAPLLQQLAETGAGFA